MIIERDHSLHYPDFNGRASNWIVFAVIFFCYLSMSSQVGMMMSVQDFIYILIWFVRISFLSFSLLFLYLSWLVIITLSNCFANLCLKMQSHIVIVWTDFEVLSDCIMYYLSWDFNLLNIKWCLYRFVFTIPVSLSLRARIHTCSLIVWWLSSEEMKSVTKFKFWKECLYLT